MSDMRRPALPVIADPGAIGWLRQRHRRLLVALTAAALLPMVIYGVAADVSIGRLFLGGFVPGILMGISLMAMVAVIAFAWWRTEIRTLL